MRALRDVFGASCWSVSKGIETLDLKLLPFRQGCFNQPSLIEAMNSAIANGDEFVARLHSEAFRVRGVGTIVEHVFPRSFSICKVKQLLCIRFFTHP